MQYKNSMIKIRNATKEDAMLLFKWANDIEVRNNAINNQIIKVSSHLTWFNNKIASPLTHIFILFQNEMPIGQIRFDKVNDYYEIDYSIDEKYRGKGFGSLIAKYGMNEISILDDKVKIKAIVKPTNLKSENIFIKLGFDYKETLGNNFKVFVYEF